MLSHHFIERGVLYGKHRQFKITRLNHKREQRFQIQSIIDNLSKPCSNKKPRRHDLRAPRYWESFNERLRYRRSMYRSQAKNKAAVQKPIVRHLIKHSSRRNKITWSMFILSTPLP
jgi:hypothetical protein